MKKFTSVLVFVAFITVAFAQEKVILSSKKMDNVEFATKAYDTLVPYGFTQGGAVLFSTDCGGQGAPGYLAGTNCYGDLAKAQLWLVDNPLTLIGCIVWIGERVGNQGTVNFNVYAATGNGTALSGAVNYAPSTILATKSSQLTEFAEDGSTFAQGAYVYTLTTPLYLTNDFYTGLDFSGVPNFPTNKFGIVSSEDGSAGMTELAWEKWDNNQWYSLQGAGWGGGTLDIDLGFFPIVDQSSGVDEFVNNMKLNIYPNPVTDIARVDFELKNAAQKVNFMVLDMTGKVIVSMELGALNAGQNSVSFDASQLAAGTYIYLVTADRNRLAKQFNVE